MSKITRPVIKFSAANLALQIHSAKFVSMDRKLCTCAEARSGTTGGVAYVDVTKIVHANACAMMDGCACADLLTIVACAQVS